MINKINNNQISDILKDLPSRPTGSCKASGEGKADASLQVSYDAVIQNAQQAPAADVDAVARARQLINSGELDSPENIRKAAENMVKFGV